MRFALLILSLLTFRLAVGQDPCAVTLVSTPITCPGDANGSLTVTGAPGLYTYLWDHDPTITVATAPDLAPGFYTVTVIDTSGCISQLEAIVADPIVPPLGTITTTDITCPGLADGSVTFTLNPGLVDDWEWLQDPNETNTTLTGLGPGGYGVNIQNDPGCPSIVFAFLDDPQLLIEGSTDYCPGAPPLLTLQLLWGFQPDLFIWSTGDSTASLQIVPGTEGLVQLAAVDTASGCALNAEINLTILPSPTVEFALPDSVCEERPFIANTVATDADSLVWRWQTSGFSTETDPTVVFTQPFWQPISLQGFDSLGCGNLAVLDSIYVRREKPAVFTVEQIPCTPRVLLTLDSEADSCAFFIGDSLYTNACFGVFNVDLRRYQEYDFTMYATQTNFCNDTLASSLDVRTEPTLFLPNAFSPDGDGINDTWPGPVDIPENGFELQLFDRWGAGLWSTTDTQEKWNGANLPIGVYVYTMRMRDPCEPTKEVATKGVLTLVR